MFAQGAHDEEEEDDLSSTYLTFDLADQTFGVGVSRVREILDQQRITRLPNAPGDVEGVVDVRGRSVPILDLRSRLGAMSGDAGDEVRIVVLEIGDERHPIGVLADRVRNVDVIPPEEIEPVPSKGLGGWDARDLVGLSRRDGELIVLLDVARIFEAADVGASPAAGHGLF